MSVDLEIENCVKTLKSGGIIIFPNEAGWHIGCDLLNSEAINAILQQNACDYPSVMLHNPGNFNKFVSETPDVLWDLIEFNNKPMNVILSKSVNVPASLLNADECTFRIVKESFIFHVMTKFGKPLFGAVLKDQNHPSKQNNILNKTGYVVNLRLSPKSNPDNLVIIRLSPSGKIEFIKK